jgi:hypothetical protein
MYGYQDDNVSQGSGTNFGLNQGIKMVKFEYNPNCGKDGAEMEGLDIVFNNGVRDISYRQFPITKVFDNNTEITDTNHVKFKEAMNNFNAIMTHIMTCFISRETYAAALSKPISSFKDFCKVLMQLLPDNYSEIELDAFFQYQWDIKGENTKTYLELPKKVTYGKFLCATIVPTGNWKEMKQENPLTNTKNALYYKDEAGNIHPFIRNGWFMNSPFANQKIEDSVSDLTTASPETEEGQW